MLERSQFLRGIAEVKILYDYSLFIDKSNEQKKRDTLDIIMKGLKIISENYKTDMKPFEEIKSMIVSADYQNNWVWKTKWNPGRKYNAIVYVEHEVDNAIIKLKIEDKKGNTVFNNKLVTAKPDEWDYAPFLGKMLWQNSKDFVFMDKKNNVVGKWSGE